MVHEKPSISHPKAKNIGHEKLPLSQPLDTTIIQKMIQDSLPSSQLVVTKTELLANHLHRTYVVHLSNSSQLILKLLPPPNTLLLRHERHALEIEATVLSFLSQASPSLQLPYLIHCSKSSSPCPFLLTTQTPCSRTLSSILSALTSPNGQFGPCHLTASSHGFHNWRDAFASMVDSLLMDGEDAGVLLPYAEIRDAMRLGRGSLGNVKVAKLVLLGKKTDLGSAIWGDIDLTPEFKVVGVKGLLYTTYHSLTTIVTNHYRPRRDAGEAELDARKTLTRVLGELANAAKK
ncbi:hypothetical protein JMJ35_000228 [Cladonia borealis]|uniref:Uncharacterized protein n=1 Tax=Cladonia borealis TaxID=184061 RepID=A0AA39RBB0_9LECA|nr:hypothetical protein JMJ35_000228 [Cladonia borealis]